MKHAFALIAAALLAFGPTACGEGHASSTTADQTHGNAAPASTASGTASASTPGKAAGRAGSGSSSRSGSAQASSSAGRAAESANEGFPPPAPRHERYPHGDTSIQTYGHKAAASDTEAIASIVRRYYSALGAGNGGGACELLSASIAGMIVRTFGSSPALHGKGCGTILQALFKSGPARVSLRKGVEVTAVRVNGDRAFALLHGPTISSGEIPMLREGGSWKVNALMGSSLP